MAKIDIITLTGFTASDGSILASGATVKFSSEFMIGNTKIIVRPKAWRNRDLFESGYNFVPTREIPKEMVIEVPEEDVGLDRGLPEHSPGDELGQGEEDGGGQDRRTAAAIAEPLWTTIQTNRNLVVEEDVLLEWDTSLFSPGAYVIQLVVTDSDGQEYEPCRIPIQIGSQ